MTTLSAKSLTITLDTVKEHADLDEQYCVLREKVINRTFAANMTSENPIVKEFYNIRDRLSIIDNVLLYGFEESNLRLVIPKSL